MTPIILVEETSTTSSSEFILRPLKMPPVSKLPSPSQQPKNTMYESARSLTCECLYKNISHVFHLASVIGLNVSTLGPQNQSDCGDETSHGIRAVSASWQVAHVFSRHSLVNLSLLVAYVYMTVWIYLHLSEHLGLFFHGVDYYALALDVVSNFIMVSFLLIHARLKGRVLAKVMNQVRSIHTCFCKQDESFAFAKGIRYLSIALVIVILTTTVLYGSLFLYMIFGVSSTYLKKDDWLSFSFVLQKFGHFFLPFYSQTFVALFIVVTEVVRQFYLQVALKISSLLASENGISDDFSGSRHAKESSDHSVLARQSGKATKFADEFETFRLAYEKLRTTVDTLSHYFGIGLLTVCCISVVSITAAIYTIILNLTDGGFGQSLKDGHQGYIVQLFFVIWAFHLYFSFFNLGAVLLCGQRVADASREVAKSIQQSSMKHLDDDTKFQISLMLKSIHGAPVEISACCITKMTMGFVASAVGNVITYILVLLQFKSSFSSSQILYSNATV